MAGGTTIVDRLNKLSGKDATTIAKALENVEETGIGGGGGYSVDTKRVEFFNQLFATKQTEPEDQYYTASIESSVPKSDPDVVYVIYDGQNYLCEKKINPDGYILYGANYEYIEDPEKGMIITYDFSEYPFSIQFYREENYSEINFSCKDSGNHLAVLSADEKEIKVSDDFTSASMLAVTGKASSEPMYKVEDTDVLYDDVIPDVVKIGDDDVWIVFAKEQFENVYNKLEKYKTYVNPYIVTFDGVKYGSSMEYTDSTNTGRLALRFDDGDPDVYLCIDFHLGISPNALYLEDAEGNRIDLSTFGSHTLKLEINQKTITTSDDFVKAVNSLNRSEAAEPVYLTIPYSSDEVQIGTSSKDPDEIYALYMSGKPLVFNYRESASSEGNIYIPTDVRFEHSHTIGMSKCVFYIDNINYTSHGDLYFIKGKFTILRNGKVAQLKETEFYITKDYVKPYNDGITG